MYYFRESKNDSPYVSVSTLINPQKSGRPGAFAPNTVPERSPRVLKAGDPPATAPPQVLPTNLEISKPGDPGELEADRIADQVTSSQPTGYHSPALQMRSQIRTLSFLNQQRPVIQRKEKTWGGEWEASQYNAKKEGSTIKASIKIEFTPGGSVDTKRIGFVQTVRVYNKGTPYFGIEATPNDKEEKETKEAHAIKATNAIVNKDTGVTDEGTRIDRRVNYRNPVYGTSNQLEEKDKSELDLANYSGLGGIQYGYKYIDGSQQKEQNAWMTDFPKLPGTQENSGQVFETAAIALAGKQTGMYYGSVQWGWKADDQGKPQPVPFKAIHESVPSATFLKAARIWNESKTLEKKQEGYDEQGKIKYKIKQDDKGQPMKDEKEEPIYEYDRRATLKLPVPDVKVITEPIKVGGVDFPAGTRIGIAANQIVVVDGRDFGKYSMVSPEDMEKIKDKIKDERP